MNWEPFELEAVKRGFRCPVGVDEAGRGPLAGPVVAAACYLKPGLVIEGLNDSKKLSAAKRAHLYDYLLNSKEVEVAVAEISPQRIDEINILQATFEAMLAAVDKLAVKADFLLIDGNRAPKTPIESTAVIKGDGRVQSIAAASIVAKHRRDLLMEEIDREYPQYRFSAHKGYPTKEHLERVEEYGPSPHHRLSFGPLKERYNYSRELQGV